ncbi:DUF1467 family protein [Terrarubrum flagellatum]|uniref:DUF1467 family protein n=1 Tax=Terrirubrum flagellatum TaxID=2895980 RepID=UPI003144D9C6
MSISIPWGSLIAIYFVVWWVLLFAVLPFGVRSQAEAGEIAPGTEPGAPVAPQLVRKAIWTSIVALAATAVIALYGGQLLDWAA